ncbi:Protein DETOXIFICATION 44, chloroplastic [Porphyridium purpureum]|uniref:Protein DETOXIFICATION 44, chloroplastic n=1 Tax=Porphyridium purpureum TaxID=35688 RepID=A0A5J4Z3T9_PORPP|nr:Protein DETOXIFICATION 44, chloroplastic [Porphyridium purpureum]|eukprot:POR6040..scf295_1
MNRKSPEDSLSPPSSLDLPQPLIDSRAEGQFWQLSWRKSPFDDEVWSLAVPALGSLLVDPFLTLVDTACVGRLGLRPLAAMGPCSALTSFIFATFQPMYTISPALLVTRASAKKDLPGVARAVRLSASVALGMGTILALLSFVFARPLLSAMGATELIIGDALAYFRARIVALPFMFLLLCLDGAHRGVQDTVTPFRISMLIGIINLVLDPLLMFGPLKMGLRGAAIATSIAQICGAIAYVVDVLRRPDTFGLHAAQTAQAPIKRSEVMAFMQSSWALLVRQVSNLGVWTFMSSLITRMGLIEIASHQLVLSTFLFLTFLHEPLSVAGQILCTKHLVEDTSHATARAFIPRLVAISLALSSAIAVVAQFAMPKWLQIMATDAQVQLKALSVMRMLLCVFPMFCLVWLYDSFSYAASDFSFNALSLLVAGACTAPIALMLARSSQYASAHAMWFVLFCPYFTIRLVAHVFRTYISRSSPFRRRSQANL